MLSQRLLRFARNDTVKKDVLASYRYAQALFELAHEIQEDEYAEAALESLSAALKAEPALERYLNDPLLKPEEKRRIFERIFEGKKPGIDKVLVKFTALLFRKNRFYLIHDVAEHFRKIADESQGQGVAQICSAAPLCVEMRDVIVARIERISGKKMVVQSEVDVSLLGGVRVKVGNRIIDDSARTKLDNFRKELTKVQNI